MPADFGSSFIAKVYRKLNSYRQATLLGLLLLAITTGLLLQPHARNLVFGSWTRPQAVEKFLAITESNNGIDTRTFWEFREKYAPGNFTFDPGVEHLGTQVIQSLPLSGMPLHTFQSRFLNSKDFVLPIDSSMGRPDQSRRFLETQVSLPLEKNIVYADESNLIYRTEEGKLVIFFYRPIEELYRVDGLFDFTESERKLLQDTYWLNLTVIE